MLFKLKTIIPESHRGLLFKNQQFQAVLMPGCYEHWNLRGEISIQQYVVTNESRRLDQEILHLVELHPEAFAEHVMSWETAPQAIGMFYEAGVLKDIAAPGRRGAHWKAGRELEFRMLDISNSYLLGERLADELAKTREPLLKSHLVTGLYTLGYVPEGHIGFLLVSGVRHAVLQEGQHGWWLVNPYVSLQLMDLRLQTMEVNGQEILTKDKVSLRINVSATWQVLDAIKVRDAIKDHEAFLYRELQLALRSVVSTQTLDQLLADKNLLNQQVHELVLESVSAYGLDLKKVGVRDIVLPGDMKDILIEVVAAEKQAEANLIRRREETQATRSLHNTAKLMEGNPVLLRLKELEVLESITENVHELKVYGGLEGVMKGMVRLD